MSLSEPRRRKAIGAGAGFAAFAAAATLGLMRGGHVSATSGRLGPEGVPVPAAVTLAPPRALLPGASVDGIACQQGEQVLFHIHAHLTIVVRGGPRRVPAGIGVGPPRAIATTPNGPFVTGGACFAWLHTHAADGIIHTESPIPRTYTLGNFFDIWGQPLSRSRVGPARGTVVAFVDGRVFTGNPAGIPLRAHAQIQLDVGRPVVRPTAIVFPQGL
jgi:hypothetical protein